ncbi:MAG: hypothetical protein SCH98_12315, partial [Deferrisomatales bacterium]|nr:hypothetical protein [Deferrisomatales bacterium]
DVKALSAWGYRVEWVRAADMFPQTAHLEAAVLLRREGSPGARTAEPARIHHHFVGRSPGAQESACGPAGGSRPGRALDSTNACP